MNSQSNANHVFVPITDEMIYEHPEQIEGPLVPYAAGMECHEWLSIEINPDESIDGENAFGRASRLAKATSDAKPSLSLAYSAN